MIRIAFAAVVLALNLGCARATGEYCTDSKECASGTICIQSGGKEIVDGGPACDANRRLCSITCSADTDCAALGTGYICIKDCYQGSCLQGSH